MKYLFLLMLITINHGCSKYQLEPSLALNQMDKPIKINSYTIHMNKKIKIWTKDSLLKASENILQASMLLDSIPLVKSQNNKDYFHMDIDIKYWQGGAGGDAYLSAITLGIIPTWGEDNNLFEYKFNLYKNGKLYRSNNYSVNETHYSHILLLPFALIDNIIFNPPLDFYRAALHTNIQVYNKYEETNNLPSGKIIAHDDRYN